TPGAYLTRLRLEQARLALVASERPPPLARLAQQWRLGGAEQLRRLFQRHYGISPSLYYQRFGPKGPVTTSTDATSTAATSTAATPSLSNDG
ncbi:helix-turn-helix domain-containing protein, partial [Halomonas sp. KM-1]|uniref:helix-turn-helix domain-containing protein n=1 Tax=Halomonas sp. KM-1 TaxID=590061 RepID=UPI0011463990